MYRIMYLWKEQWKNVSRNGKPLYISDIGEARYIAKCKHNVGYDVRIIDTTYKKCIEELRW